MEIKLFKKERYIIMIGATVRSWSWIALGTIATGFAYAEQGISLGIAASVGLGVAAVTAGIGLAAAVVTGGVGLVAAIPAGLVSLIVTNPAPLQSVGQATVKAEKAILDATVNIEKTIFDTTVNVLFKINTFFSKHIANLREVYTNSSNNALKVGKEQEMTERTIKQTAEQEKQAIIMAGEQKYAEQEQHHHQTRAQLNTALHSASSTAQIAAQQSATQKAVATNAVDAAKQSEQSANTAYKALDKAIEKAEKASSAIQPVTPVEPPKIKADPQKMAAAKAKMRELKAQGIRMANVSADGADVVIGEKAQQNSWRPQEPSAETRELLEKETHASPGVGAC